MRRKDIIFIGFTTAAFMAANLFLYTKLKIEGRNNMLEAKKDKVVPEFLQKDLIQKKEIAKEIPIMSQQEYISKVERERLVESVKGMSREQLAVIAECIPFDICFTRLENEMKRNQEIISGLKKAVSTLDIVF